MSRTETRRRNERVILGLFLLLLAAVAAAWFIMLCRTGRVATSRTAATAGERAITRSDAALRALDVTLQRQAGAIDIESLLPPPAPVAVPSVTNLVEEVVEALLPEAPPETPPPPPVVLRGVVQRGHSLLAVINDQVVARGDTVAGYTVLQIRREGATLRDAEGNLKELPLYED